MSEFIDLGESPETGVAVESKSSTKYYPSVRLNQKQIPQLQALIKDKKVKDFPITITLLVEAEVNFPKAYGNGDTEYDIELRKAVITEDEPEEAKEKMEE